MQSNSYREEESKTAGTIGRKSFEAQDCTEEEYNAIQNYKQSIDKILAPWPPCDENDAIMMDLINKLLSAYPFGQKFDPVAMSYKVTSFIETLDDQPLWAIRQAVDYARKELDKEPSAKEFRDLVKKQTEKYRWELYYANKAKKA